MDLFAYMLVEKKLVSEYVEKNYGPVPRCRGMRLMRYETPDTYDDMGLASDIWAEYCGKDVIYFHTRCGGCGDENDENSNYVACGGKAWEERLGDKYLNSVDDPFDCTYRDHYFTAVIDDLYNKICKEYEEGVLI